MYKIQQKSTGMFIKGTPTYWRSDKNGRVFSSLGNLRSFITCTMNSAYTKPDYSDWNVVEFEMVVKDVKPLHEIVKPEKIIKLLQQ